MTTVEIFLDSKTNVFFPNSEITGKIYFNTIEAETIQKVNATIVGRAYVFFLVSHYHGSRPYESEHYYLNENECLWKLNETNQLLNGEYLFPFKFIIPSNAPANVNEEFGEIQYFIKADIEFYGKKFGGYKKYNEFQYYGFSVCPLIDLNNLDPKLKLSASTKITQIEDKCFSCTKKPLNVKMSLPKSGFVCGEIIPIKIKIKNKTSMKIESIEYGIELKCLYVGNYECLCFVETLNKETTFYVAKDFIKPESDSTICNIIIPPISPSFTDCSILKLEYSVFVKIHTNAFFQSGPIISIPITIGTVPMKKIESEETLNAMEILKSANFLEGSNRCKMDGKYKEIEGPCRLLVLVVSAEECRPEGSRTDTYLNQKRKAQNSMMITCKRTKFMATYHRQNFSMPDFVIFYIAKNPKTAEFYLKMVKTCKYFFIKNPIIIIPNLYAYEGNWRNGQVSLNLIKYNCKCWITNQIHASAYEFVDKNIFSSIIPKLYQCDIKHLLLISYHDLSLLISSAELISFTNVIVKHADSSDVPFEDIVAIAVKAKQISDTKPTTTPKTMKELTKLPNFTKLDYFALFNLSEVFDIDAFYSYMKKNQHTKMHICFDPQISDAFKNRLETIVDEILERKQFNYKPPFIHFYGLDIKKYRKLRQIYCSH